MIKKLGISIAVLFIGLATTQARETLSFNDAWKFNRFGTLSDGSLLKEPSGMEQSAFDDSSWRTLNTPHDWGIEGPFRADLPNQTGKLP